MKGNRTDSRRETAHLRAYTRTLSEETESYRKFAENRRKRRRFTQQAAGKFYDLLVAYIEEQAEQGQPLTIAGACLAMGVDVSCFYRMKNGDYDGRLIEFLDEYGIDEDEAEIDERGLPTVEVNGEVCALIAYSDLVKRFLLLLQEQAERRLYSKSGKVTDIFTLRALFGWQDGTTTINDNRSITLNTVAPLEEAAAAMKRLSDDKE